MFSDFPSLPSGPHMQKVTIFFFPNYVCVWGVCVTVWRVCVWGVCVWWGRLYKGCMRSVRVDCVYEWGGGGGMRGVCMRAKHLFPGKCSFLTWAPMVPSFIAGELIFWLSCSCGTVCHYWGPGMHNQNGKSVGVYCSDIYIWLSAKRCACKGLCTSVENKTLLKTVFI